MSKAIDKSVAEEATRWSGWGTALKPATEPIVVARKPLVGTVAANVLKYGTGGLNIDGCRVEGAPRATGTVNPHAESGVHGVYGSDARTDRQQTYDANLPDGRWPANVVLVHADECRLVGSKTVRSSTLLTSHEYAPRTSGSMEGGDFHEQARRDYAPDGTETVDEWECVDGCPVRVLDEQTGEQKSGVAYEPDGKQMERSIYGSTGTLGRTLGFGDTGGASRFYYTAKASRGEREAGVGDGRGRSTPYGQTSKVRQCNVCGTRAKQPGPGGRHPNCDHDDWRLVDLLEARTPMAGRGQPGLKCRKCGKWKVSGSPCVCDEPDWEQSSFERPTLRNLHPTVKPIELMRWLVRLVTTPSGRVLDPFAGSGTTGVAAVLEGFNFVGVEQDDAYCEIANARIKFWDDGGETAWDELRAQEAKTRVAETKREEVAASGQLDLLG